MILELSIGTDGDFLPVECYITALEAKNLIENRVSTKKESITSGREKLFKILSEICKDPLGFYNICDAIVSVGRHSIDIWNDDKNDDSTILEILKVMTDVTKKQ